MKKPDNLDLVLASGVLYGAIGGSDIRVPGSILSERIEKVAKWLLEQA